ncbi:hypothetical protein [Bacillus salipaludis]|uniref:Uncharacterized protein n=1 Tax=Bacillus salipaludis TaxID=2547811 RepID=A0ABW8RLM7_9BACI
MALIIVALLIASKSYFNNKEIATTSDRCYEAGGQPVVEMTSLALHYSFSCQKYNESKFD